MTNPEPVVSLIGMMRTHKKERKERKETHNLEKRTRICENVLFIVALSIVHQLFRDLNKK